MHLPVTFVLTSCGRWDLLTETLRSFFACNTVSFDRCLVIEDSGSPEVREVVGRIGAPIDVIVNDPRLGQLASIDRVYAEVRSPYVFHCEDDWRFYRGGFIEDSLMLLDAFPEATMVGCRRMGGDGGHDRLMLAAPVEAYRNVAFRRVDTKAFPPWGGYSFNPGLRRLADYREVAPVARFKSEADVSRYFAGRGRMVLQLEHSACETIGKGRHVADPTRPDSFRQKLKKARKKLVRAVLPAKR